MVAAWWLLGGWLVGWLAAWLVGWCNRSYTSCWKSSGPNKNNKSYSWSLGLIHAFLPLGKPFGRLGLPAVLLHSHLSGLQSWKLEDTFSGRGGSVKLHIGEWMYMVEKQNQSNEANSNGGKEHEALVIISGDQILNRCKLLHIHKPHFNKMALKH